MNSVQDFFGSCVYAFAHPKKTFYDKREKKKVFVAYCSIGIIPLLAGIGYLLCGAVKLIGRRVSTTLPIPLQSTADKVKTQRNLMHPEPPPSIKSNPPSPSHSDTKELPLPPAVELEEEPLKIKEGPLIEDPTGELRSAEELFKCGNKMFKETPEEAVELFKLAADKGNVDAQINLGHCYEKGIGIKEDKEKAFYWYSRAAEQHDKMAEANVGVCYQFGIGVDPNLEKAVEYYTLAAKQGDDLAQYNLGFCYEQGKGVDKDETEAVKYYRLSAEQGHSHAQFYLGQSYELGYGVAEDKAEAIKYYRLAAAKNHPNAQEALDELLNNND